MPVTDKLHPPGNPTGSPFGLPTGFLGMLAGWIMGRVSVEHNRWAVSHLAVAPGDSVLEIGSGPGVALRFLAERATDGFVAGVDPSPVMRGQARKRNAARVEAGRVELNEGSASAVPYPDHRFDKALSVNNIMLWPDLTADLREVARVLQPGGLLVISLCPMWAKSPDDVRQMGQEIAGHVTAAGYSVVDIDMRTDLKPHGAVAVSATAPR